MPNTDYTDYTDDRVVFNIWTDNVSDWMESIIILKDELTTYIMEFQ